MSLVWRLGNQALVRRSGIDEEIGQGEIRVVEDIEELRAELKVHAIENLRAFGDRKIHVPELGAENRIPAQIAKRPVL